jgi:hypothetical protein
VAYVVDTAIETPIEVRRTNGTAVTGLTAASFSTLEAYLASSPATTATVSLAAGSGGGQYIATFTPTVAGTWVAHAVYTDVDSVLHEYGPDAFVVETATVVVATTVAATTGTTRKTLRRDILGDLGDVRILTATDDGSDTTFIDTENLFGEVDAYKGREFLLTGGTEANLGEIRYVTGSSASQMAIGFGVSLPADTAEGDEGELINTRGIGFRFRDVHEAINRAIRTVAGDALVPTSVTSATYARGDGIALPDEFATVEYVQWLDPSDDTIWRTVPKAPRLNGAGWAVDRSTRTVVIGGSWSTTLDGQTVQVWGLAEPAELDSDTDATTINPEYVKVQAEAYLMRALYLKYKTQELGNIATQLRDEAGVLRRRLGFVQGPLSEQL